MAKTRKQTEMAADNLQSENPQQHHAKRKRANTNEAGAETPHSTSTPSTHNEKPSNISKKKCKEPTAQAYLSAASSEYFDPVFFLDSDIDDAFDDPWMVRELEADATATTAVTAQTNPPGTEAPCIASRRSSDMPSGAEQLLGVVIP